MARSPTPPATTSTTSRSPVRLHAHRPQGRGAGSAAEPGRRFRRRRHVPRLRRRVCAAGGAEVGQGPGGGCRHGGRRGDADGADVRHVLAGKLEGRARRQRARHGRALVRHLQDQGRQVAVSRRHRGALLRRVPRSSSASIRRRCPSSATARAGPICASASPRPSRARRARSGSASSRAATPALRRSCRLREVENHPHNTARATFTTRDGVLQPSPAPRFSRTEPEMGRAPQPAGADTDAVLARLRVRVGGDRRLEGERRRRCGQSVRRP